MFWMTEKKQGTTEKMSKDIRLTLSFLALLARASIYRVLLVLAAMVFVESALFFVYSQKADGYALGSNFYNQLLFPVFLAALGLIFFRLMWTEAVMGDAGMYTLQRLRISGSRIFFAEAFYNFFCLLMVFIVQIWLSIGMLSVHTKDTVSSQHLFLALYKIEFLHCLFPMAEVWKWLRNILLLLAFSMGAACGFGKRDYVLPVLTFLMTICWFISPIGREFSDFVCILLSVLGIVAGLRRAWLCRFFL